MARKSRNRRRRRVSRSNARRSLPTPTYYQYDLINDYLRPIEDRREFHPERSERPARSVSRSHHRLVIPDFESRPYVSHKSPGFSAYYSIPNAIGFEAPRTVLVCVRRRRRKEVLHALGKTGKAGQKPPRRSAYSDIQC